MFGNVINGFVSIFSGKNIIAKHLVLLLISIFSYWIYTINGANKTASITMLIIAFLLSLAFSMFFGGYLLSFVHNAFDGELKNKLPEITFKHFNVFFGAIPLYIVWGIYYSLFSLLLAAIAIPFLLKNMFVGIIFIIILFLWSMFFPFIYIGYAREFKVNGLFNISIIFKYFKYTCKDIFILALIFVPTVLLIFAIPLFLLWATKILFDINVIFNVSLYYFGIIINFAWHYCLVQIYKDNILPQIDE